VRAAEELSFKLSVESRSTGGQGTQAAGSRTLNWPLAFEPGFWGVLTPDQELAAVMRTAPDDTLATTLAFPALFLAKLYCEGLLDDSLQIRQDNTGLPPAPSKIHIGVKVCRIASMTADFLDMVASNPEHDVHRQANILRRVRTIFFTEWSPSKLIPANQDGPAVDLLSFMLACSSNLDNSLFQDGQFNKWTGMDVTQIMGWNK